MEDVAGQALGVHADEDVLRTLDVALDERDVMLAGQLLAERDRGEVAVHGRHRDGRDTLDELLVPAPILDQVGDRDELQPVTLGSTGSDRGRAPSSRPRS